MRLGLETVHELLAFIDVNSAPPPVVLAVTLHVSNLLEEMEVIGRVFVPSR
jgi:hypothetical protein